MDSTKEAICRHQDDRGRYCDLPCARVGDGGLVISSRHHGTRHLNFIPLDWILDNVGSTEKGIRAIRSWLDRNEETILS